ncbi:hypothetical protein [Acinetobacter sp. YH12116]|uniref:hypothetical protein n=1 Tax=Acinetobacter sp. YH12116 TaxID=2601103 RepID=UPI0015D1995D|nr:hypothetical protein [Acinetobacter sp. YH12116]
MPKKSLRTALCNKAVTAQKAIKVFMQRDFMIKGVNYLAPNDSKYTDYLSFTGLNPKELYSEYFFNLIFNAEIRYEDLKGKKYKNTYKIDTSERLCCINM